MAEDYNKLPEDTYRPLLRCLTIAKSNIDGLGLFATQRIEKDTGLGITHIKSEALQEQNNYEDAKRLHNERNIWVMSDDGLKASLVIATPIGQFMNHSDTPNCINKEVKSGHKGFEKYIYLQTNQVIEEGDELTVNYKLYTINQYDKNI
jgi:SET domain-containing protein